MKLRENKQIQKDIDDLADIVKGLKRIVTEGETDDIDFVKDWQDTCYFIRQTTHDIAKKVNKHVSETLNPEYYEAKAKKRSSKVSAKKEKDAVLPVEKPNVAEVLGKALIQQYEIKPISRSKKSKITTIPVNDKPTSNPAHEEIKPFE